MPATQKNEWLFLSKQKNEPQLCSITTAAANNSLHEEHHKQTKDAGQHARRGRDTLGTTERILHAMEELQPLWG